MSDVPKLPAAPNTPRFESRSFTDRQRARDRHEIRAADPERRKSGPPRKDPATTLHRRFAVMMSEAMHAAVHEQAHVDRCDASEWVRRLVTAELARRAGSHNS